MMQERVPTSRLHSLIKHKDDKHYILNTHSLHNHAQILSAIPKDLHHRPYKHLSADLTKLRPKAAAKIRTDRVAKAIEKAAKDAATTADKAPGKKGKEKVVPTAAGDPTSEHPPSAQLPVVSVEGVEKVSRTSANPIPSQSIASSTLAPVISTPQVLRRSGRHGGAQPKNQEAESDEDRLEAVADLGPSGGAWKKLAKRQKGGGTDSDDDFIPSVAKRGKVKR